MATIDLAERFKQDERSPQREVLDGLVETAAVLGCNFDETLSMDSTAIPSTTSNHVSYP